MQIHVIKPNGDSVLIDAAIVHIDNVCSIADNTANIKFWSNPVQHDILKQLGEMPVLKTTY